MSGMEPMLIGAMLGGGVSAARGGNPLKGALLGAVGGGIGGAALGAGNAAATAGMTGASAVPVGAASTITPMTAGATYSAATPGMIANFGMPTMPTFAATGGSTGLIPSITAAPTLMDRLSAATKFSQENPFQMNMASNMMQQDAQRDAQRLAEMRARSGLMTGKQIPTMPQQRSNFGVPQLSLI